jgi:hypothetical protein
MRELWVIYVDDSPHRKRGAERVTEDVLKGRPAETVFDELYAAGKLNGLVLDAMWILALDKPSKPVTRLAFRSITPPELRVPPADAPFTDTVGRMTPDTMMLKW